MEQNFIEEEKSVQVFDIKNYITRLLRNFYWFIIAIAVFGAAAYFYLRSTIPLYKVSTLVLIKPPTTSANLLGGAAFGGSQGQEQEGNDLGAEITKFKAQSNVETAVDSLHLDVVLFSDEKISGQPLDQDSLPFTVSVRKSNPNNYSPTYKLILSEDSYLLTNELKKVRGTYDSPLVLNGDSVIVSKRPNAKIGSMEVGFEYWSRQAAVDEYAGRVDAGFAPKSGPGMLEVSMKDEFPSRAHKIINVLIYNYDKANVAFKNQSMKKEMDFLNTRLAEVTAELEKQENQVRDFKAANKINDVSSSANEALANLTTLDAQKTENALKNDMLKVVEGNLSSGKDEPVSTAGLTDANLAEIAAKYNAALTEKKNIIDQGAEADPRLAAADAKIAEYKTNMSKTISGMKQEIIARNNFLSTQEKNVTGRYVTLPEKEKDYIQMNRLLGIKQSVYTFLLQRKEDKSIEFASQAVEEARIIGTNKSTVLKEPNDMIYYLVALGLGLILPAVFILIKMMTNNKIESKKEITMATGVPIAGEITFAKEADAMVITAESVSPEAEQFRSLRTNIGYLSKGVDNKVLLVTSSVSQEGKSYVSMNLANSYAIRDKKVVLLEFDLRDPGLSFQLGIEETRGLANYLRGEEKIQDVIQKSSVYRNFYFVSSGFPLPSNPGEVILSQKMTELFAYLNEHFDVIIIDTPPVGLVSDALSLGKYATSSFFVVRHKYSLRSALKLLNQLNKEKRLPNISVIINGIKSKDFAAGGYNYGYGYGYGYGNTRQKRKRKLPAAKI